MCLRYQHTWNRIDVQRAGRGSGEAERPFQSWFAAGETNTNTYKHHGFLPGNPGTTMGRADGLGALRRPTLWEDA